MRIRRFKVDDLGGDILSVSGREAEHALRVLRLKVGTQVVLFDGTGEEVTGRIISVGDGTFEVEVQTRRTAANRPAMTLTIASAVPKGQRADWMVEKCAEFGTAALAMLQTDRGEVEPGEGKLSRWRRKAVEAAKQSGSTTEMEIVAPQRVEDAIRSAAGGLVLHCDPHQDAPTLAQALTALPHGGIEALEVWVFVGPEGGFTDREIAAIEDAGGRAVRLADSILRIETAAIAVAAAWASWAAAGD